MRDSRSKLIQDLNTYATAYPQEQSVVDRFLKLLYSNQRCFYRDCYPPGHITGSAWLTNAKGTHVLLTHHRKLNKWLQLGGHSDGNENVIEVASREALEESGIEAFALAMDSIFDVDIHTIPAHGSEPEHEHFDIRIALKCIGNESFTVSDESHDLRWVDVSEMENFTTEASMLRLAKKWKNHLTTTTSGVNR